MPFALVLTYHAVQRGPAPLCVEPALFAEHLDCILASGAHVVTVTELAAALRNGALSHSTVSITFDDGFTSVVDNAWPLLAERGLRATVFCVAGYLGGKSDWPSARPGGFRAPLATSAQIAELAACGVEIGSHGMEHAPLICSPGPVCEREVVDSKLVLEEAIQARVTSYAYPYGAGPTSAMRRLVADTYEAVCTTAIGTVRPGTDPLALPRLDVHYVRRPALLQRALDNGIGPYLASRRVAARARRAFRKDYATA